MIHLLFLPSAFAGQLFGMGTFSNTSLTGQSDFRIRYRTAERLEPNFETTHPHLHDYIEQIERVNFLWTKKDFSFGLQLDQVGLYLNKYILDDELKYSWMLHDSTVKFPFQDFLVVPEKPLVIVTHRHSIS